MTISRTVVRDHERLSDLVTRVQSIEPGQDARGAVDQAVTAVVAHVSATRRHLHETVQVAAGDGCASADEHSLRRLEVGPFSVTGADSELIHPAAEALPFLPVLELSDQEAACVRTGKQLQRSELGLLRLCREGRLIAVALGKNGTVRTETVMPV